MRQVLNVLNKMKNILIIIMIHFIILVMVLFFETELYFYMELFMIFMKVNESIGCCYSIMNLMVSICMSIFMIDCSTHSTLIILILIHFYSLFYSLFEQEHYILP